jgi:uncharacterized membrane protein YphA (DoxX/SURF4 family)
MNALLWIVQVVLAALYAGAGATKIFLFEKYSRDVASMGAFSPEVWTAIAVFELLCAAGLVLPAITKDQRIASIAAAGLAVEGVLLAALHWRYGETWPMAFSLILSAITAGVAVGRRSRRGAAALRTQS